jgi:predicted RNA-binding Zn-ribbon protein involved in translation (DUF1610 family)
VRQFILCTVLGSLLSATMGCSGGEAESIPAENHGVVEVAQVDVHPVLFQGDNRPEEPPPKKQYAQKHQLTFIGKPDKRQGLELWGQGAEDCVIFEEAGLRINLPADRQPPSPVGVELAARIRGDFDISMGYEVLAIGEPAPTYGAGVAMRVIFDNLTPLVGMISRSRRPKGDQFVVAKIVEGPDGNDQYQNTMNWNATGARGRLRLERTGPQLRYWVAEGDEDYREIQAAEFGTADVKMVRLYCTTSGSRVNVDVRLNDLRIEADGIAEGGSEYVAAPKGWLAGVVLFVVLLTIGVGAWLIARWRLSSAATNASAGAGSLITFECSHCGKKIKAQAEMAGKQVKCPQCGKVGLVPVEKGG